MAQVICGERCFPSQAAFAEALRSLLWSTPMGTALSEADTVFVLAAVARHPNATAKIGPGVAAVEVRAVPGYPGQHGYVLRRTDGSRMDFSYKECIRPSTMRQQHTAIARQVIAGQIMAYKAGLIREDGTVRCQAAGEAFPPADIDIDHRPPQTFVALFDAWLAAEELCVDTMAHEATPSGIGRQWPGKALTARWQAYHLAYADLWAISHAAHVALTRTRRQASVAAPLPAENHTAPPAPPPDIEAPARNTARPARRGKSATATTQLLLPGVFD